MTLVEGSFTTWSLKWKVACDANERWATIWSVRAGRIFLSDDVNDYETSRRISDGGDFTTHDLSWNNTLEVYIASWIRSLNGKYFCYAISSGGAPHLIVYGDGVQVFDGNLNTLCGWVNVAAHDYNVSMSSDGKYIAVINKNVGVNQYALFEGR